MTVNIADHGGPILWEGVYDFALSDYPNISDWELRKLIKFIEYEKVHNRETEIVCEDKDIREAVNHALANPEAFLQAPKPSIITYSVCTECRQKGCLTDYLCHATGIESAKAIFKCGKLLSTVKVRGMTGEDLAAEREASHAKGFNDPPDYYEYIMFSWGNCFIGDKIVMEKLLGRYPDEYDLSSGFKPGVRFYFTYDAIISHKNVAEDGSHPAKVKDELSLNDYLHCCIIPASERPEFENIIPASLADRVFYIENDCKNIWEWCEKVYTTVLLTKALQPSVYMG